MTEAPKVIWAGVMDEDDGGYWYSEDHGCDHRRYIRSDAPELVALVEALTRMNAAMKQGAWSFDDADVVNQCLAKWEALTK